MKTQWRDMEQKHHGSDRCEGRLLQNKAHGDLQKPGAHTDSDPKYAAQLYDHPSSEQ